MENKLRWKNTFSKFKEILAYLKDLYTKIDLREGQRCTDHIQFKKGYLYTKILTIFHCFMRINPSSVSTLV